MPPYAAIASQPPSLDVNAAISSSMSFEPSPDDGSPRRTTAGGSRNPGQCPGDRTVNQPLAVIPTEQTIDSHSLMQIQVPETSARSAEFSVFDESGRGLYQTLLALGDQSEIVSIALPSNSQPSQPNQRYRWVFSLICQSDDRLQDRSISGWIQHLETSASSTPNSMP